MANYQFKALCKGGSSWKSLLDLAQCPYWYAIFIKGKTVDKCLLWCLGKSSELQWYANEKNNKVGTEKERVLKQA